MTLDAARQRAAELKVFGRDGRNPVAEHKLAKLRNRIQASTTFEAIAEDLLTNKKKNISDSHYNKVSGALKANLYPLLGSLPIQEITSTMLTEALRPLERRGALDYLAGLRRWAGEVFDYAKAHGVFLGDNPAHALRKNVFQKHKGKNVPSLPWGEMGNFIRGLDGDTGEVGTIAAIRLIILTAVRPGEALGSRWEEFDFDRARWEIPAERMKKRQMHAVPLSRQAIEVLQQLQIVKRGEYLFPTRAGSKHPTLPNETLGAAIKRITSVPATPHGFRSTFSTHVSESLKWDDKVKESCLAHARGGKIEGTYDRATFYPERAKLLQWYADEIDSAVKGADVIQISSKTVA
jgi:integrase